jgi:FkbM family methyltransferase
MPRAGVAYMPPNFIYFPRFSSDSIVIDVGCSYEAELSVSLIEKFGVTAYAVDPTHKHAAALAELADTHRPRFVHLPVAVCAADGPVTFHESSENESGSVRSDHINVLKDTVSSYQVEGLTPMSLLKRIGVVEADLIKLDIEGAEYDLLRQIDGADLAPFKQIFVEFHHHAVAAYSEGDTRELVRRIENFGFKAYSADDHNYLFDRSGISME